jgi:hypothetical protein
MKFYISEVDRYTLPSFTLFLKFRFGSFQNFSIHCRIRLRSCLDARCGESFQRFAVSRLRTAHNRDSATPHVACASMRSTAARSAAVLEPL